jgi:sulfur-oxidizing protein SoxY
VRDRHLLDRRRWLLGAAALLVARSSHAQAPADHRITLDIPLLSEDPTGVPVALSIDHPMEPDHYIRSVEVSLGTDPVPYKGTFQFTPANGRAAVAFKMRSGSGGTVRVVAECTKHGTFTGTKDIRVAEGGCAMPPDGAAHAPPRNVQIRLPQNARPGDVVEARVRVDHNTETGLAFKGGRYVREAPEFFLREMVAFLDDQKISEFRMSSAVSPNPIIRFPIRVPRAGTLKVAFVNSANQRAEATRKFTG